MRKYLAMSAVAIFASLTTVVVAEVKKSLIWQDSFAGPIKQTTITRFVDPSTGHVCYVYYPNNSKQVQDMYGATAYEGNGIGSISCVKP